ncbi:hypothetical protein P5V15_004528 [Pogonomyrmex californicus]
MSNKGEFSSKKGSKNDDLLTRYIGASSSGKHVLDIATDIVVYIYNGGLSSIMQIMAVLGMTIGPNCCNFCQEADARRIKYSKLSMSEAAKEATLTLKSIRKEEEEKNMNLEDQLYGAGIAN